MERNLIKIFFLLDGKQNDYLENTAPKKQRLIHILIMYEKIKRIVYSMWSYLNDELYLKVKCVLIAVTYIVLNFFHDYSRILSYYYTSKINLRFILDNSGAIRFAIRHRE
jgi:hypothetical protein